MRIMDAVAFRGADRVITVSNAAERTAAAEHAPQAEKLISIHNGITVEGGAHDPLEAERLRFLDDEIGHAHRVLLLGRLRPEKGHHVAFEALQKLRDRHPDIRLIVAGDGPYAPELEAAVRALGLEDEVCFLGRIENVRQLLEFADVLIVPSLREAFGLVAVEGLQCAVPVIASRVDGLAEIITDGETGLLIPPGASGPLAEAIVKLKTDTALRERLARQGRLEYEQRFSPEVMAAAYHRVYLDLSSGSV